MLKSSIFVEKYETFLRPSYEALLPNDDNVIKNKSSVDIVSRRKCDSLFLEISYFVFNTYTFHNFHKNPTLQY